MAKASTTKASGPSKYLYAALGAGDLLLEKTRTLGGKATTAVVRRRTDAMRFTEELATRGQKVAGRSKKQPATSTKKAG